MLFCFSYLCRYLTNHLLDLSFIFGQFVPFIVGFDSIASDPWLLPQGGARGQIPGYCKIFYELFVFEHLMYNLALTFFVTSDLWVYDPGWG